MSYARVSGRQYFEAFAVATAGDAILSFAVLYELLRTIVHDYPLLKGVGRSLYRWAALVLMAVALVLAWLTPSTASGKLIGKFSSLVCAAHFLQCGLLLFLFAFARSFGLSWRSRTFGIALGFGVAASLNLALAALRVKIEPVSWNLTAHLLALGGQVADLSAVSIWLAYLWQRETAGKVPPPSLPNDDLGGWNQELRRLLP